MLFYWIRIPEKDAGSAIREEFDTWVDSLSQVVPSEHIFVNSSEETAMLLEKAHPETVVHRIRVDIIAPFTHKHADQLREDVAFIQNRIRAGNMVVFLPYKEYVFDGMRYVSKEVK